MDIKKFTCRKGDKQMGLKHVITLAFFVMCISVSYYFVIALPNHNAARLELEKQQNAAKLELEKQRVDMEKQKAELEQKEKQERKDALHACNEKASAMFSIESGCRFPGCQDKYRKELENCQIRFSDHQ